MEINPGISCPICTGHSTKIKTLNSAYIKNKLSAQFNEQNLNDVEIVDYDLMRCDDCSFEFAFPEIEGSGSFYDWITKQPEYYVESRWEYAKVLELFEKEKMPVNLLDVGCGDGQFFDTITQRKNSRIDFYGLDTTSGSIEICKSKNYKAFCMDVQKFKSIHDKMLFDVITSFHVLEHIADPKKFLADLVSLIKPTGAIYISTPYSPMDFELDWYDVLNHPPHHMGRWNLRSYKKIAEILGLTVEVFMPEYQGVLKSAMLSLSFSIHGNKKIDSKIKILKNVILHPIKFLDHLSKQLNRTKISGKAASNVILVKFTKA
ncbi:MAG: class I SAM-dependent methyltransferase [Bacteroidota bacterium]|nr:class I SAM-dependent methyltransferase [Bacteroidota bacterium]